ncbi:RNA polymerase sigma factor [Novosphingobium beihaiensis]|uniref:Sigma-70 family RNA polymerase sigma factor n=1 Tax=Novosphingobium beihaiensis TaxID=2930389 RepID=A0ABT0BUY2_9SPHN|nr:sigma-70 family RNA polymerase sigma factor [Novosphingobium beihaiensis]MCJ2188812.1 sigma-70 family RNA polymerase sigma factor [Novosphingobium beihaiensis]
MPRNNSLPAGPFGALAAPTALRAPEEDVTLTVYREQYAPLIAYAARILGDAAQAEDVVQDAWIAASRRAQQVEICEFGAYLRLTVRNLAIDVIRRCDRYGEIAGGGYDAAMDRVADIAPGADDRLAARQELERFHQALAHLPERQRIAVEMHRIGNYKLREIAERLNISVAYAQDLVAKGLAACARFLAEGR